MPLLEIPFRGSSTRPHVRQRVTLDGVTVELLLGWNGREGRWYATVLSASGDVIVGGRKLVVGARPFKRVLDPRMPPGRFGVIDRMSSGTDPGLDDFADRVVFAYLDAASLAEVA